MGPLGVFSPVIRFSALDPNSRNFRDVGYLAPMGDLRKLPTSTHMPRQPQGCLMAPLFIAAMPRAEVGVAQDGARREPREEPRSSHLAYRPSPEPPEHLQSTD